jgi:hypothetical protein
VADPSTGDEHLARPQQSRNVSYARDAHLPCALEFSRSWIVEIRGLIEILIAPHAAGDEHSLPSGNRVALCPERGSNICDAAVNMPAIEGELTEVVSASRNAGAAIAKQMVIAVTSKRRDRLMVSS